MVLEKKLIREKPKRRGSKRMRILAIDTETTGLPPKRVPPTDHAQWPYIVQLSYVMLDTETDETKEGDHILRVPVDIPTTRIHGITKERSDAGENFGRIYGNVAAMMEEADIVVGHNLDFDLNMIRAECERRHLLFHMPSVRYCTMRESKERVGLVSPEGYVKYPKLGELMNHLFQEEPKNWHNALSDAYMALRCFHMLVLKKDHDALAR